MGATTMKKPESVKDFLDDLYSRYTNHDEFDYRILASAIVSRTEYYCAVEKINKVTKERVVWAGVASLFYPRDPHFNFGYKDMSENEGPVISNCPERILKLLTPTTKEHAVEWRKRCRARLALREKSKGIKGGEMVKFAKSMRFGRYGTFDTFRTYRVGSKIRFMTPSGLRCQITNWREREFEILADPA